MLKRLKFVPRTLNFVPREYRGTFSKFSKISAQVQTYNESLWAEKTFLTTFENKAEYMIRGVIIFHNFNNPVSIMNFQDTDCSIPIRVVTGLASKMNNRAKSIFECILEKTPLRWTQIFSTHILIIFYS